jgi:hypothetical protein
MGQAQRTPEAEAERSRLREARLHRQEKDLRTVLGTPAGRRVLQNYMQLFGIFDDIPPNNNAVMQHSLGKRSAALVIRNHVRKVNAGLLPQMEQELAAEPPLPTGGSDGGS